MRISAIIHIAKQYLLLSIPIVFIIISTFLFFYFLIYKKIMKGSKKLNKTRILIWSVFLIYIVIVLGATLINRAPNSSNNYINTYVFETYMSIWYGYSSFEFRNLILNILMFIPFGFMLPLLFKKCEKFYITYFLIFGMSLFIEISQLVSKRGLFEVNDLINNTLGGVIGYGFVMVLLLFASKDKNVKKHKLFSVVCYQIPMLLSLICFTYIFINRGFVI